MALDDRTDKALEKIAKKSKIKYPLNKAKTTSIGHKWEMNESPGEEYINLRHGITGAYIKMHASGDVDIQSPVRDVNIVAARHVNVKAGSNVDINKKDLSDRLSINVVGNAHLLVEGDMHHHVKGDRYDRVDGKYFLTVGDSTSINSNDLGINCLGNYQIEANKMSTSGQSIETNVIGGGAIAFNYSGSFSLNAITPGSTISFNSAGNIEFVAAQDFQLKIGGSISNKVGGKVDFQIAGVPLTKPLTPLQPAFTVNTALGGISLNALVGKGNFFAGGPSLDVDCLTGVYLN